MLCVLFLLGPAETVSGKYLQHSAEYRAQYPSKRVAVWTADVGDLCTLIEKNGATPELWVRLGDALLKDGQADLAYRAFHRAHRARPKDGAFGKTMQARKKQCTFVPDTVIQAEEREAKLWVQALQNFERERLSAGADPRDRTEFYARYGDATVNMWAHIRARRLSFAGGACGILVGLAYLICSGVLRRRSLWLPVAVAVACLLGPVALGQTGLFYVGAVVALFGAAVVFWRSGRRE